jgi:hypothetical protein
MQLATACAKRKASAAPSPSVMSIADSDAEDPEPLGPDGYPIDAAGPDGVLANFEAKRPRIPGVSVFRVAPLSEGAT